ncbi:GDP-L-fucose synthase family protein [Candidatus Pelagibacter sp. HIMB1746]|uniref:GDP-L-fucose synthase family protein n=1 Tax=Candidatus Pelagibacter sp. HIMB1746 TaxID=3413370 RepID=UPI003F837781
MTSNKSKLFIAGHNGMVGRSLKRLFDKKRKFKILTENRKILDLRNKTLVYDWFKKNKPDIVINAAGKVGGIITNSVDSIDFLNDNIEIGLNLLNASNKYKVKKFINIGSSCIYPKLSRQPIKEKYLLDGKLEETNKCYALAKILVVQLCQEYYEKNKQNFISVMPTNLYGPFDNYNDHTSHVLAALIKKIYLAKKHNKKVVEVFGNGKPLREFLYVDDLAEAIYLILKKKTNHKILNIGSGEEISIIKLANKIANIVKFKGKFILNKNKPNGTPRKFLNSKNIRALGWKPKIKLNKGLKLTLDAFISNNQ